MRIGFIGLGNMGAPMARRLLAAGHAVTGYDAAGVEVEGEAAARSAADAAAGSDAVVTMVPDGAILARVYAEAVAAAGPLFAAMGARAVHCGASGAGQAAKICNNLILGVSMIGVCEAFALAEKLGLVPLALYDVVSTSSGACWSVTSYCPVPGVGPSSPADRGYLPGFAAELMLKDLGLGQQAAAETGAATPLAAAATALYRAFVADGNHGRDFSAILPWLSGRSH